MVEVKPKRPKISTPLVGNQSTSVSINPASKNLKSEVDQKNGKEQTSLISKKQETQTGSENPVKSLLGLAYASSDDED